MTSGEKSRGYLLRPMFVSRVRVRGHSRVKSRKDWAVVEAWKADSDATNVKPHSGHAKDLRDGRSS